MLATRSTITMTSPGLPQAVHAFVGSALELMIHSVEAVRDRVLRRSAPRAPRHRALAL